MESDACPECGATASYVKQEDCGDLSQETLTCPNGHQWVQAATPTVK